MAAASEARVVINLREGLVEFEGTESFVNENLKWIREYFDVQVKSLVRHVQVEAPIVPAASTGPIGTVASPTAPEPEQDKYVAVFGAPKESVNRVIHTEADTFTIIVKKIPGKNKAEKEVNLSLLYCLASEFYGRTDVAAAELRRLCKDHACLDGNNFAAHLKKRTDLFLSTGKQGSPNFTVKLTMPGKERAQTLLASLIAGS
ncbi:MAG: hypothetical protein ACM3XZ_00845 [Betaproteobacteria bacterium]